MCRFSFTSGRFVFLRFFFVLPHEDWFSCGFLLVLPQEGRFSSGCFLVLPQEDRFSGGFFSSQI